MSTAGTPEDRTEHPDDQDDQDEQQEQLPSDAGNTWSAAPTRPDVNPAQPSGGPENSAPTPWSPGAPTPSQPYPPGPQWGSPQPPYALGSSLPPSDAFVLPVDSPSAPSQPALPPAPQPPPPPPSVPMQAAAPRPPQPPYPQPPYPGFQPNEPWLIQGQKRRRKFPTALVFTIIGALVIAGAGGYGFFLLVSRDTPNKPDEFRVSQLADADFTADRNSPDGLKQTITDVTATGNSVVAAGSETGGSAPRPRFLFSADQGRNWQTAKITVQDREGSTISGRVDAITGTEGAWLAIGGIGSAGRIWTSKDGRSWTQQGNQVSAFKDGDRVEQVTRTDREYVAVGYRGEGSSSSPILWLSSDAKSWQRLDGKELKLTTKGGAASRLHYVAASGDRLIVSGEVIKSASRVAAIWRSTDGGRSWSVLDSPSSDDAFGPIHLGATDLGFLALREGKEGENRIGVVFSSANGDDWKSRGRITTSAGAGVTFQRMTVGDQGNAVLATGPGNRAAIYQSVDGASWQQVGDLADNPARAPVRLATVGTATIVGGNLLQGADQNGYLAVASAQGNLTEVDLKKVPGAANAERSVRDLHTAAGRTIAVGSSNGKASAWVSTDGVTWSRADTARLGGSGQQDFVKVTYGTQGWLAIGSELGKPFAATSGDGKSWQRVDDGTFAPKKGDAISLTATAYGSKGYVIAGTATTVATKATSAVTWHSADLRTWQRSEDEALQSKKGSWRKILGLAGSPSNYVAVGESTDPTKPPLQQSRPAIWTSTDGRSWSEKQTNLPDEAEAGGLASVAIKGNTVVAAGEAVFTGTRVYTLTSNDLGATWRGLRLPTPVAGQPSYLSGITSTTEGIAIVGTLGGSNSGDVLLWNSPDGRDWRTVAPKGVGLSGDGYQRVNALTQLGDRLLGVGITADSGSEHITLWRPPVG